MSRQDANAAFARTSFLYGGNADYIEDLYARYETDPKSVDTEWQVFFQSLKDDRADVLGAFHECRVSHTVVGVVAAVPNGHRRNVGGAPCRP